MPPLPSPLRAALGLAATMLDEARHLPDKAIELPMIAVSRALQLSLRAQQRYTAMATRGDEVLAGGQTTDEPPSWATFDEPVADTSTGSNTSTRSSTSAGSSTSNASSRPAPRPSKTVRSPRTGKPSAFDAVGDNE